MQQLGRYYRCKGNAAIEIAENISLDFRLPFYDGNKNRFQLDNIYDI